MSEGVEWVLHSCTVLAALPEGRALPAAKLAEFHGVPPAYLAKHLQAAAAAGIVASVPGPRWRISEQRGPVDAPPATYRRPCGIARAMWRAEDAWRDELRATTVGDLVAELLATLPADVLVGGAEWLQAVEIRRSNRTRSSTRQQDQRPQPEEEP